MVYMEPLCEFCRVVRAVVYCKSDSARLCLSCDGFIHSANTLSCRHFRSLLCDKCNSQPAIIRCLDEKMSLCQTCDWNGNGCSSSGHRCQTLNGYMGCPSPTELTRIWAFVLDGPQLNGTYSGPLVSVSLSGTCLSNCLDAGDSKGGSVEPLVAKKLNELESCVKLQAWPDPSSVVAPNLNSVPPRFISEDKVVKQQSYSDSFHVKFYF